MELANLSSLVSSLDAIKAVTPFALSNIMDYREVCGLVEKKACLFLRRDSAMLLLVPHHDSFYDIFYCAQDTSALKSILADFKNSYDGPYYARISVIGKEAQIIPVSRIFEECGFTLSKKKARTQHKPTANTVESMTALQSPRSRDDNSGYTVSFAAAGDEEEILSLLLEEFDVCDDDVPELEAIKDSIEKKEIVVSRDNGIMTALNYFKLKNHTCYSWYDVTRKEYRHKFEFFDLYNYRADYFSRNNIVINRYVGWRNPANRRLMKFAARFNEFPDGIYVHVYRSGACRRGNSNSSVIHIKTLET